MAKISLNNIVNTYNTTLINDNFDDIEAEFQNKVLYRNNPVGEPNHMLTNLDMNGKRIINLPTPISQNEPVRVSDIIGTGFGTGTASLVTFTPYANISSTNVQAAIKEEIDDLAASSGASLIGTSSLGTGAVVRTQESRNREFVSVKDFGALGGGNNDSVAIAAAAAYAVLSGKSLKFPKDTYLLTSNILTRTDGLLIDGENSRIILGSNSAGFSMAGSFNHIRDFQFSQSSQTFTPLAIKFFNDATTLNSQHNRASNCSGDSVYQGIQVLMNVTGANAACYRAILTNCSFQNFYLQKTWSGSFGFSFDGPNAGDAGGNDSKAISCLAKGYQKNFLVNNSVATQFTNCTGDGADANFSYEGASSGLQIIGGYYEFNTDFLRTVGATKYDAYILYPSLANNTNLFTGTPISFISGGLTVGAPSGTFNNGAFINIFNTGVSEIYAVNGTKIYSGNTKTLRMTLGNNDDWLFESGRLLLKTGMSLGTDTITGYTGGATPLTISPANSLVINTNSTQRVSLSNTGDWTFTNGRLLLTPGVVLGVDAIQGYTGGATPLSLLAANIITFTTGGVEGGRFDTSGNFLVQRVGTGVRVKEGSNAKQGIVTLVAGSSVVANTSVTANSRIQLTGQADGGTPGFLRVSARTAATSFTITSSSGTDTSVVAYEIFEPA